MIILTFKERFLPMSPSAAKKNTLLFAFQFIAVG